MARRCSDGRYSSGLKEVTEMLIRIQLYRLMVLWNYKWTLLIVPAFIYVARVGVYVGWCSVFVSELDFPLVISIPLLISRIHPNFLKPHAKVLSLVFDSLCVVLNLLVTSLISLRIYMMRRKAEMVLGRLQASLYTSTITIFVETGAFFTLWSLTYWISLVQGSWIQDIFLQPYTYVTVSQHSRRLYKMGC